MAKTRTVPFAYKLLIIILALAGIVFIYNIVPRYASVETVLNGDTLLLENGSLIKLIGVYTPECNDPEERVRRGGTAAADFTQNMVEGKKIRIEYHHRHNNTDGKARASVYLMDGTYLNAEIIRQGYGHADSECASGDAKAFQEYERQARDLKRGLWAEGPGF